MGADGQRRHAGRVLIVRLGALGDILHAIPAQQQLARCLEPGSVHWLTDTTYSDLLRCVPGIDRVWEIRTKVWKSSPARSRELIGLVRQLRRERFDWAVDFQGLLKSAALARVAGARKVIGYLPEKFKEPGIQLFYNEKQQGEGNLRRHVIDANGALIQRIVPTEQLSAAVPFVLPEEAVRYVDEHLERLGCRKPILLNPGAGWVTKRWPAPSFRQLAWRITQELGHPVVFTYGPGEESLIRKIGDDWPGKSVPTFQTSIVQLACLCKVSSLMIAGDSGPLHLAVATGTPTVALFGPTSRLRNGPYHPDDEVVQRDLPCSNSYKRKCNDFICMDIPVDQVFEAVRRRLSRAEKMIRLQQSV